MNYAVMHTWARTYSPFLTLSDSSPELAARLLSHHNIRRVAGCTETFHSAPDLGSASRVGAGTMDLRGVVTGPRLAGPAGWRPSVSKEEAGPGDRPSSGKRNDLGEVRKLVKHTQARVRSRPDNANAVPSVRQCATAGEGHAALPAALPRGTARHHTAMTATSAVWPRSHCWHRDGRRSSRGPELGAPGAVRSHSSDASLGHEDKNGKSWGIALRLLPFALPDSAEARHTAARPGAPAPRKSGALRARSGAEVKEQRRQC